MTNAKISFYSPRFVIVSLLLFLQSVLPAYCETNLIPNGNFENGKLMPDHWGSNAKKDPTIQVYESAKGRVIEGKNLLWNKTESPTGRCIEFRLNEPAKQWTSIAATSGMEYESEYIPCTYNQKYKISIDIKSVGINGKGNGPEVKMFVKAYRYDKKKMESFEVYRAPMHCYPENHGNWSMCSRTFKIKVSTAQKMKVVVYAYWPKGVVCFDNVRLIEINE